MANFGPIKFLRIPNKNLRTLKLVQLLLVAISVGLAIIISTFVLRKTFVPLPAWLESDPRILNRFSIDKVERVETNDNPENLRIYLKTGNQIHVRNERDLKYTTFSLSENILDFSVSKDTSAILTDKKLIVGDENFGNLLVVRENKAQGPKKLSNIAKRYGDFIYVFDEVSKAMYKYHISKGSWEKVSVDQNTVAIDNVFFGMRFIILTSNQTAYLLKPSESTIQKLTLKDKIADLTFTNDNSEFYTLLETGEIYKFSTSNLNGELIFSPTCFQGDKIKGARKTIIGGGQYIVLSTEDFVNVYSFTHRRWSYWHSDSQILDFYTTEDIIHVVTKGRYFKIKFSPNSLDFRIIRIDEWEKFYSYNGEDFYYYKKNGIYNSNGRKIISVPEKGWTNFDISRISEVFSYNGRIVFVAENGVFIYNFNNKTYYEKLFAVNHAIFSYRYIYLLTKDGVLYRVDLDNLTDEIVLSEVRTFDVAGGNVAAVQKSGNIVFLRGNSKEQMFENLDFDLTSLRFLFETNNLLILANNEEVVIFDLIKLSITKRLKLSYLVEAKQYSNGNVAIIDSSKTFFLNSQGHVFKEFENPGKFRNSIGSDITYVSQRVGQEIYYFLDEKGRLTSVAVPRPFSDKDIKDFFVIGKSILYYLENGDLYFFEIFSGKIKKSPVRLKELVNVKEFNGNFYAISNGNLYDLDTGKILKSSVKDYHFVQDKLLVLNSQGYIEFGNKKYFSGDLSEMSEGKYLFSTLNQNKLYIITTSGIGLINLSTFSIDCQKINVDNVPFLDGNKVYFSSEGTVYTVNISSSTDILKLEKLVDLPEGALSFSVDGGELFTFASGKIFHLSNGEWRILHDFGQLNTKSSNVLFKSAFLDKGYLYYFHNNGYAVYNIESLQWENIESDIQNFQTLYVDDKMWMVKNSIAGYIDGKNIINGELKDLKVYADYMGMFNSLNEDLKNIVAIIKNDNKMILINSSNVVLEFNVDKCSWRIVDKLQDVKCVSTDENSMIVVLKNRVIRYSLDQPKKSVEVNYSEFNVGDYLVFRDNKKYTVFNRKIERIKDFEVESKELMSNLKDLFLIGNSLVVLKSTGQVIIINISSSEKEEFRFIKYIYNRGKLFIMTENSELYLIDGNGKKRIADRIKDFFALDGRYIILYDDGSVQTSEGSKIFNYDLKKFSDDGQNIDVVSLFPVSFSGSYGKEYPTDVLVVTGNGYILNYALNKRTITQSLKLTSQIKQTHYTKDISNRGSWLILSSSNNEFFLYDTNLYPRLTLEDFWKVKVKEFELTNENFFVDRGNIYVITPNLVGNLQKDGQLKFYTLANQTLEKLQKVSSQFNFAYSTGNEIFIKAGSNIFEVQKSSDGFQLLEREIENVSKYEFQGNDAELILERRSKKDFRIYLGIKNLVNLVEKVDFSGSTLSMNFGPVLGEGISLDNGHFYLVQHKGKDFLLDLKGEVRELSNVAAFNQFYVLTCDKDLIIASNKFLKLNERINRDFKLLLKVSESEKNEKVKKTFSSDQNTLYLLTESGNLFRIRLDQSIITKVDELPKNVQEVSLNEVIRKVAYQSKLDIKIEERLFGFSRAFVLVNSIRKPIEKSSNFNFLVIGPNFISRNIALLKLKDDRKVIRKFELYNTKEYFILMEHDGPNYLITRAGVDIGISSEQSGAIILENDKAIYNRKQTGLFLGKVKLMSPYFTGLLPGQSEPRFTLNQAIAILPNGSFYLESNRVERLIFESTFVPKIENGRITFIKDAQKFDQSKFFENGKFKFDLVKTAGLGRIDGQIRNFCFIPQYGVFEVESDIYKNIRVSIDEFVPGIGEGVYFRAGRTNYFLNFSTGILKEIDPGRLKIEAQQLYFGQGLVRSEEITKNINAPSMVNLFGLVKNLTEISSFTDPQQFTFDGEDLIFKKENFVYKYKSIHNFNMILRNPNLQHLNYYNGKITNLHYNSIELRPPIRVEINPEKKLLLSNYGKRNEVFIFDRLLSTASTTKIILVTDRKNSTFVITEDGVLSFEQNGNWSFVRRTSNVKSAKSLGKYILIEVKDKKILYDPYQNAFTEYTGQTVSVDLDRKVTEVGFSPLKFLGREVNFSHVNLTNQIFGIVKIGSYVRYDKNFYFTTNLPGMIVKINYNGQKKSVEFMNIGQEYITEIMLINKKLLFNKRIFFDPGSKKVEKLDKYYTNHLLDLKYDGEKLTTIISTDERFDEYDGTVSSRKTKLLFEQIYGVTQAMENQGSKISLISDEGFFEFDLQKGIIMSKLRTKIENYELKYSHIFVTKGRKLYVVSPQTFQMEEHNTEIIRNSILVDLEKKDLKNSLSNVNNVVFVFQNKKSVLNGKFLELEPIKDLTSQFYIKLFDSVICIGQMSYIFSVSEKIRDVAPIKEGLLMITDSGQVYSCSFKDFSLTKINLPSRYSYDLGFKRKEISERSRISVLGFTLSNLRQLRIKKIFFDQNGKVVLENDLGIFSEDFSKKIPGKLGDIKRLNDYLYVETLDLKPLTPYSNIQYKPYMNVVIHNGEIKTTISEEPNFSIDGMRLERLIFDKGVFVFDRIERGFKVTDNIVFIDNGRQIWKSSGIPSLVSNSVEFPYKIEKTGNRFNLRSLGEDDAEIAQSEFSRLELEYNFKIREVFVPKKSESSEVILSEDKKPLLEVKQMIFDKPQGIIFASNLLWLINVKTVSSKNGFVLQDGFRKIRFSDLELVSDIQGNMYTLVGEEPYLSNNTSTSVVFSDERWNWNINSYGITFKNKFNAELKRLYDERKRIFLDDKIENIDIVSGNLLIKSVDGLISEYKIEKEGLIQKRMAVYSGESMDEIPPVRDLTKEVRLISKRYEYILNFKRKIMVVKKHPK